MKKTLRKLTIVSSIVAMMAVSFTGCAKKTECEGCSETKKCNKYEISYDGESESGYLCDDCYEDMKGIVELVGGKIKKK